MDGFLVFISIIDLLTMGRGGATGIVTPSFESDAASRIFGMLRVFRLLRTLRPLRGKSSHRSCSSENEICVIYSHQPCAWPETCCSNLALLIETHRSHRCYLLYILHYFRHPGCSGTLNTNDTVHVVDNAAVVFSFQLFKGKFYYCEGPLVRSIKTRQQCEDTPDHRWKNQQYNFDNLGQVENRNR